MTVLSSSSSGGGGGRNLLYGMKQFQRFLNQERANLCASPILLLDSSSSSPPGKEEITPTSSSSSPDLLKHVQLLCTSVGLRTTISRPSSDHFPFVTDVQYTIDFAKRIGASSVIGVGGSASIELAKTIASCSTTSQQDHNNNHNHIIEQLILVPGTPAATIFANATSHSLLLDPEEPAMIPNELMLVPTTTTTTTTTPHVTVLPENNKILSSSSSFQNRKVVRSSLYAALVLLLDTMYRERIIGKATAVVDDENNNNKQQQQQLTSSMIDVTIQLIDHVEKRDPNSLLWDDDDKKMESQLQQVLCYVGSTLSYGLSSSSSSQTLDDIHGTSPPPPPPQQRSIPLALASSLVPTTFPNYQMIDFISCLLPGMVSIIVQDEQEEEKYYGDMVMQLYHKLSTRCPKLSSSSSSSQSSSQTSGGENSNNDNIMGINSLMSQIHSDGARWDCLDVDDRVLEKVLDVSLDL